MLHRILSSAGAVLTQLTLKKSSHNFFFGLNKKKIQKKSSNNNKKIYRKLLHIHKYILLTNCNAQQLTLFYSYGRLQLFFFKESLYM